MPAPKMTVEAWNEVRKASEMGVEDSQLSQDYGVSQSAIRMRRSREKWLTKRRLMEEAMVAKAREQAKRMTHSTLGVASVAKPAEMTISEGFLRDGELAQTHAMKVLLSKLSRAAMDPNSVEDISTVQDTVTALKGARLIAGLDKEGQNVVLNLGAFWNDPGAGAVESPVVVEVEDP